MNAGDKIGGAVLYVAVWGALFLWGVVAIVRGRWRP
jgi:hypothetical protein